MPSRKRRLIEPTRVYDTTVCAFCGTSDDNEFLGKLIVSDHISAHENCLYFASGLSQNGEETDKFLGFLHQDVDNELRRGKKLWCFYCRKRGATIGCAIAACKKSFHLNCGIENGSLHQHFDSFSSFCKEHKPKQKVLEIKDNSVCFICSDKIDLNQLDSCLYSPCCKNGWFHKICLQKHALSAGRHYFKCPLCNDSNEFILEMTTHGIRIPDKDASWELEEHAYEELLRRPECDGPTCLCAKGRKYCPVKKSGWTLVPCSDCGSHARHKNCENIPSSSDYWVCDECKSMEEEITKNKISAQATTANVSTSEISDGQDSMLVSSAPSSSTVQNTPLLLPLQDCVNTEKVKTYSDVAATSSTRDDLMSDKFKKEAIEFSSDCSENKISVAQNTSELLCEPILFETMISETEKVKKFSLLKFDLSNIKSRKSSKYITRRAVKKQKIDLDKCCGPNHHCIKRYFGHECGKYRV